jgi:hypothetical protein
VCPNSRKTAECQKNYRFWGLVEGILDEIILKQPAINLSSGKKEVSLKPLHKNTHFKAPVEG